MSPYPARIVLSDLIEQAQQLLEVEGVDGLTLAKVAGQAGVRAASLYNHFTSKADLLGAINALTMHGLVAAMREATESVTGDAQSAAKIRAMADAYRTYAHTHPVSYGLAFTNTLPDVLLDPALATQLALPLQAVMAELVGADSALDALRGGWALLHGFVMLELGGQFRRGDLDSAFHNALDRYITGWTVG